MSEQDLYMCIREVRLTPMTRGDYARTMRVEVTGILHEAGYCITHPNGSTTWESKIDVDAGYVAQPVALVDEPEPDVVDPVVDIAMDEPEDVVEPDIADKEPLADKPVEVAEPKPVPKPKSKKGKAKAKPNTQGTAD